MRFSLTTWNINSVRLRIDLADALLSAGRRDDARAICSRIDIDALAGFDPALQIRALRLLARERKRRERDGLLITPIGKDGYYIPIDAVPAVSTRAAACTSASV